MTHRFALWAHQIPFCGLSRRQPFSAPRLIPETIYFWAKIVINAGTAIITMHVAVMGPHKIASSVMNSDAATGKVRLLTLASVEEIGRAHV